MSEKETKTTTDEQPDLNQDDQPQKQGRKRLGSAADPHDASAGKMFIGGLSWETTEDRLKEYFSKFGEIESLVIMTNPTSGKSRGFGFLTFVDESSCDDVLESGPHELDGRTIDPKKAVPRNRMTGPNAGPRVKKIFVGGLPPTTTEDNLRAFFSEYGNVEDVTLQHDRDTHRPRGFGFVTFDSEETVDKVVEQHYFTFLERNIEVKRALPRDSSSKARFSGYGQQNFQSFFDGSNQNQEGLFDPSMSYVPGVPFTPYGYSTFPMYQPMEFNPYQQGHDDSGQPAQMFYQPAYGMGMYSVPAMYPNFQQPLQEQPPVPEAAPTTETS